jgi:acyl-CoA oxidase
MFVPAIKGQGTEEQQQKWLPLAYKFQIIGCYAQTELGHGSNVQGLETTATFDPKTDEFVIHSPTLTSSKVKLYELTATLLIYLKDSLFPSFSVALAICKLLMMLFRNSLCVSSYWQWWPGGLGKASTHAVVYARLITEGKDYGIHGSVFLFRSPLSSISLRLMHAIVPGFIVQLRSLVDHSPLPGVTLGDIGGKFGSGAYNSMDNGVLRFDHVRIPRDQMLMRFAP